MGDFVQTMKDWRRMCMAMEKLRPYDSCCGCPLEGYGCPAIYEEDSNHMDYADVEKNVMSWAAEHPEPVYPTWEQFIAEMYLRSGRTKYHSIAEWEINERIPADIAQKLGIEPKEG